MRGFLLAVILNVFFLFGSFAASPNLTPSPNSSSSPTLTPSPSAPSVGSKKEVADGWFERWGLSPVSKTIRNRFENATLTKHSSGSENLELKVWYENASIRSGENPDIQVFCKIAHDLIFGRIQLRSKSRALPIEKAFTDNPKLDSVTLTYFLQHFVNRARPANAAAPSSIRVVWTREEQIIPYLSLTISRAEWRNISTGLKGKKNESFDTFQKMHCDSVLSLTPNLKSDFSALQKLKKSSTGATGK